MTSHGLQVQLVSQIGSSSIMYLSNILEDTDCDSERTSDPILVAIYRFDDNLRPSCDD